MYPAIETIRPLIPRTKEELQNCIFTCFNALHVFHRLVYCLPLRRPPLFQPRVVGIKWLSVSALSGSCPASSKTSSISLSLIGNETLPPTNVGPSTDSFNATKRYTSTNTRAGRMAITHAPCRVTIMVEAVNKAPGRPMACEIALVIVGFQTIVRHNLGGSQGQPCHHAAHWGCCCPSPRIYAAGWPPI